MIAVWWTQQRKKLFEVCVKIKYTDNLKNVESIQYACHNKNGIDTWTLSN